MEVEHQIASGTETFRQRNQRAAGSLATANEPLAVAAAGPVGCPNLPAPTMFFDSELNMDRRREDTD